MRNRVFFPQPMLDVLSDLGELEIDGQDLLLTRPGYRYRIVEAVRVLREVTHGTDPDNLCGKVKSRGFLQELGAEMLGSSMLVEECAYDVLPGFVGLPIGEPDPHDHDWDLTEVELLESLHGRAG